MTVERMTADAAAAMEFESPPDLPFRVFVAETVTGRVIRRSVPFTGVPQYRYGFNQEGSLQVSVPIGDPTTGALGRDELDGLLDYWRLSWGFAWGQHIFQAGPVIPDRFTDHGVTVDVGISGIWYLFSQKRVLLNGTWIGTNPAEPSADTLFGPGTTMPVPDGRPIPAANRDLSLQGIAVRLIEDNMSRPGCSLPIVLPGPVPGTQVRTFYGYDLAMVGDRLRDLTQVIDGPEIEFRPEFTDDTYSYIQWRMRVGNPRLGDLTQRHMWHHGQAVTTVSVDGDGSQMTFESYVRGNGMERALPVGHHADTALVDQGWPALITVDGGHTSASDLDTLNGWAEGNVATNMRPIRSLTATVQVDGSNGQGRTTGTAPIDQLSTGDNGRLVIRDHRRLPDGTYPLRVTTVSSGPTLATAQLLFEPTQGEL